ncbi:hypothetical protein K501DRAFT_333804 [Backusella circina FSU 941]|nr:hypothetical protein K501DRAFT_333804 [Backusella circina FSU 941]
MDFSSNHSHNNTSWLDSNLEAFPQEILQEPVPFEDFHFTFGMGSDFSVPLDLDLFPPPDPFLHSTTNTVLDEDDQKNFSSFLDALFVDPEMSTTMNTLQEQEEEQRRSSILQSLDEQKKLHQRLSLMASLPNNNTIPSLMNDTTTSSPPSSLHNAHHNKQLQKEKGKKPLGKRDPPSGVKRAHSETTQTTRKKSRSQKELLTEEEKRANHIASEQKRRGTIRTGFKDLTDLVPSLKNLNNSKSTVLFKAVEFISQLEKRNKALREKIESLELRVQVEGRMTATPMELSYSQQKQQRPASPVHNSMLHHELPPPTAAPISSHDNIPSSFKQLQSFERRRPSNSSHSVTSSGSSDSVQTYNSLSSNTKNALLAHKSQQNQLLKLQEQLQKHQRLIAQQQEMKEKALKSKPSGNNKLPPILGKYEQGNHTLLQELEDNAISAP